MAKLKLSPEQKDYILRAFKNASLTDRNGDEVILTFDDFKPSEIREMAQDADYNMALERGEDPGCHILDGWFGTFALQSRCLEKMMKSQSPEEYDEFMRERGH